MNQFLTYLLLGLNHILDVNGVDHILFVLALAVNFSIDEWRQILLLTTAFTVGHSLTLALSALDIIVVDSYLIETLIPCTILITALSNIFIKTSKDKKSFNLNYFYALFFGLIHGLGFSNYFKSLLGRNFSIIHQLLAFNIGLEIGQLIIIALFLLIGFLILDTVNFNKRVWTLLISSIIALKALHLILIIQG